MKIKLKKLQDGGGIPLIATIYTPAIVNNPYDDIVVQALQQLALSGGPVTQRSTARASTSNQNSDVTKLISSLLNGLDNDVTAVGKILNDRYVELQVLGTGDQVLDYYNTLILVNKVKLGKDHYDTARDICIKKNNLKDFATTSNGLVVMKDISNDELTFVYPEDVKSYQKSGKYQMLTNGNLLYERAHNPKYTFSYGDNISRIVSESSGLDEIRSTVSDMVKKLGTLTVSENGYIQKEGNMIKNGINILQNIGTDKINNMPMDGIYNITYDSSSQQKAAEYATNAIWGSISPGQRALLKLQTRDGTTKEALNLIAVMVATGTNFNLKYNINYTNIKTDQANKVSTNTIGSVAAKKKELDIEESPVGAWLRGKGEKKNIYITTDSTHGIYTKANIIPIIDSENKAFGINNSLSKMSATPVGAVLDMQNISMGDGALINPSAASLVIIGGEIAAADLPIDQNVLLETGHIVPAIKNLKIIDQIEKTLLLRNNIDVNIVNPARGYNMGIKKIINDEYKKHNLPPKYAKDGSLNVLLWRRFALLNGTTVETSFIGEQHLDKLGLTVNDESRKLYVRNVQLNGLNDFDIDNGWVAGLGADDVYSGTIFIPMSNSYISALAASGSRAFNSPEIYNDIDRRSDENQRIIENGGTQLDVSKFNE